MAQGAYEVKHHPDAGRERDWLCGTYGESFHAGYRAWMSRLAEKAAAHDDRSDAGLDDLLEAALDDSLLDNWAMSLKRFQIAGIREKLRAVLAAARTRRPPWRLRAATGEIRGLGDSVPIEVTITYEINDVDRRIVVLQVLHQCME